MRLAKVMTEVEMITGSHHDDRIRTIAVSAVARAMRLSGTVAGSSLVAIGISPMVALGDDGGIGWRMNDIINPSSVQGYTQENILDYANGLITRCLGVVIAVFIMKVALTAIDRLAFGGSPEQKFRLDDIPIFGAYRDPLRDAGPGSPGDRKSSSPWTWAAIWRHFAFQIALALGAYGIVTVLMNIVGTVYGKVSPGAAEKAGNVGAPATT